MTLIFLATSCSNVQKESKPPVDKDDKRKLGFGSIAGEDFLTFGGPKKSTNSGPGLRVNQYLWKASLETLEFMPLVSADSVGGVILTDWYNSPENAGERYKVSVYIHGGVLKANALKVVIHKQVRATNGQWIQSSDSSMQTATEFENIILSKARQLRIQDAKNS